MDAASRHTESSSSSRLLRLPPVVFLLNFFLVIFLVSSSSAGGDGCDAKLGDPKDQEQGRLSSIIDVVKDLFSRPPSCDDWVLKIRAFLRERWCFYIPLPNLDFRKGRGEEEDEEVGSKERMKDDAMKSLGASKSAFEDSAKSAAKFAEDAVDRTVDKLKRTLSGVEEDDAHHAQL